MDASIHHARLLALLLLACGSDQSDTMALSGAAGSSAGAASAVPPESGGLPSAFRWTSSGPLVAPVQDATHPIVSVKDPTVVYFGDRWHVFATTANSNMQWSMIYLSFTDWDQAGAAVPFYLDQNPALAGYHAAPQVFFFAPQNKWYLIFQSGQPQYSTNDDIANPMGWTRPIDFFPAGAPPTVTANNGSAAWLDFWVICDEGRCHLFFTDDNGSFYRSQTDIGSFPSGFSEPVVAMRGTKESLFEAGATYRVDGADRYLTFIEAFGGNNNRFFRSFTADSLDGEWTPLADTWENPFAGITNVTFEDGTEWTRDISHGELLRSGFDQTLSVSLEGLRFLYQGVDPAGTNVDYYLLPYRLGLLSLAP